MGFSKSLKSLQAECMRVNKHLLMDMHDWWVREVLWGCGGGRTDSGFWVDKKPCFRVVVLSRLDRSVDYASKKSEAAFGVGLAETCWQELARQLRDSRQCWLEPRVPMEGPRRVAVGRVLLGAGWRVWVLKCQVKVWGSIFPLENNTEGILFLRERGWCHVYFMKARSSQGIRNI